MTAVGVDIGGSGVRAAAWTGATHGPVARRSLHRDLDRDAILHRVAEVVAEAGGGSRLAVAIPSFADGEGRVLEVPSLPALEGLHLASALAERTGAAVAVVPDLAAAALAEHRLGSGRGVERFLCVALGTGANAAAVNGGVLVDTAFGCLGDAGHVKVDSDGPACPCGGCGCLEAVASGFALARDGAPLGYADARAVVAGARAGDGAAAALVERAGVALGRAIATWSALLWPTRVAVAGGLARAGELLLDPARSELARVGTPYIVGRIEVVPAALGDGATLAGAALLASSCED
jgi:glucokinase